MRINTSSLIPIGCLEKFYPDDSPETTVNLDGLGPGIHETRDFFLRISESLKVEWVISRICDHANGTLILSEDKASAHCPLHGWKLDLPSLSYTNVAVRKKPLVFNQEDNILLVEAGRPSLRLPESAKFGKGGTMTVRFLAHACLAIQIEELCIVTDPWLVGPCFRTGWWHAIPPKNDSLEILANADIVFISHNHPDHMHRETLTLLRAMRADIPIIVPSFKTESVLRPIREMGFTQVYDLPFNTLHRIAETPFVITSLKSGDFRDDSGLLIASQDLSIILTVDSSSLNHMVLPSDVDLLATSFAAGASGYPWCFENYTIEERAEIAQRSLLAHRKQVSDYLSLVRPKAYMPYAGFFTEMGPRDAFIKTHNRKNSVDEIQKLVHRVAPKTLFIDPRTTDKIVFSPNLYPQLNNVKRERLYEVKDEYVEKYYLEEAKQAEDWDLRQVQKYFEESSFRDELLLYLQPTTEDFTSYNSGLRVDFHTKSPQVKILERGILRDDYQRQDGQLIRKLFIKVRAEPLWCTIQHRLSWEDLSIGFQCRIERDPDSYNSLFWFYFTNVYIGQKSCLKTELNWEV